jgi:hypothetical protein
LQFRTPEANKANEKWQAFEGVRPEGKAPAFGATAAIVPARKPALGGVEVSASGVCRAAASATIADDDGESARGGKAILSNRSEEGQAASSVVDWSLICVDWNEFVAMCSDLLIACQEVLKSLIKSTDMQYWLSLCAEFL